MCIYKGLKAENLKKKKSQRLYMLNIIHLQYSFLYGLYFYVICYICLATLLPYRFLNTLPVAVHVEILISCVLVTKF